MLLSSDPSNVWILSSTGELHLPVDVSAVLRMQKYAPSSYDDYYCLKPPLLLWIAILYLSRAITLPIAMGIGSIAGINADTTKLLQGLWSVPTLAPSLIAAAVLYAMFRRVPEASKAVRWLWSHGRILLAVAAIIDGVLLVVPTLQKGQIDDQTAPSLFAAALNLYFLLYLLTARRVRDVFASFPFQPSSK